MEIATLPKSGLRIKGKHSTIAVDPSDDKQSYNAALSVAIAPSEVKLTPDAVLISGAGEYEISGVKISGVRNNQDVLYSINIDSIDCLIGNISAIEKAQHKLKEYNVVIANCDRETVPSFLTSLAANALVCYGPHSSVVTKSFGAENVKTMSKYQTSIDKLASEMETILIG